jgi:6-phosphogluconolactonase
MDQPIEIRVFDSREGLIGAMAAQIARRIQSALRERDHFDMVLAGGDTPRPLYRHLAENYHEKIPWGKIRFFWSDERYVPHDAPHSNYGMARETLLEHVPIDRSNIFPIPTSYDDPAAASDEYEMLLKRKFNSEWPHFDLTLLGLGEDCHIASLFPHSMTLGEQVRWVVTSLSPEEPVQRLSLTLPAINGSKKIYFLVTGVHKAEAVMRALSKQRIEIEDCPARGVRLSDGDLIWWLDTEAAAKLK